MPTREIEHAFWQGYNKAKQNRIGQGWEEKVDGPGVFQFHFVCKDCGGALPQGFVVAPRYCCFCGRDHEGGRR